MMFIQPLPLDLGVSIQHEDKGTCPVGTVIDVFTDGGFINGQWVDWPVYVVQFPGQSISRTAAKWAKMGYRIVGDE